MFGITTVYHFFFVPVTIGMTWLVAVMQTMWLRTKNEEWLRLTQFFGKLFLINFAAGVVTGIVQEFQFGMNWSVYSLFVGDIFGAPLALEALVAFFLESTFIGLWIFGWGRLPRGLHNLTMYLTALGTTISAVFIMAANAFMQNPVGATYSNGRAELADFGALLTNPMFLAMYPHLLAAAFMVAGSIVGGISAWKLAQAVKAAGSLGNAKDAPAWRRTAKFGACVLIVASVLVAVTGHFHAQVVTRLQPMKLAATEGLLDTKTSAGFAIVGIYTQERGEDGITQVHEVFSWEVPYALSILAHNDPNAEVKGINDLTQEYLTDGYLYEDGTQNQLQREFSSELEKMDVDPVPNIMASFYSFRLMIGLGMLGLLFGILILIFTRKSAVPPANKAWQISMGILPFLPLLSSSFGWIATEMGRQPWIVSGVLPTSMAHSPGVGAGEILFSMIAFTAVYGIIAVIVLGLFFHFVKKGLPDVVEPQPMKSEFDTLPFAY